MTGFILEEEFIARTEKNLRAIESLKGQDAEVYEVTQLINSLLGLLVYPRERIIDYIPNITRQTMEKENWSLPNEKVSKVLDLRMLVIKMRNAVSHFNFVFLYDDDEISGIRFSNYARDDKKRSNPIWIGEYQMESLKSFIFMLLNHIRNNKSPR